MGFFGWLILSIASAAGAPNSSLLKEFPAQVLRNEIVTFRPVNAHHFSSEAPQKCAQGAPVEANPRFVKCQFTKSGPASAELNVCDDKKTFCRPVALSVIVSERISAEPVRLTQNQSLNKELKKQLAPGFVFASPEEARKEALSRQQPVLVMVSTDWCPPCNEAKEYLLSSYMFQELTKDWYKIYVDGDSLSAADWEKTVPFSYYPSFVLLNSKLEEVARYNGEIRQLDFKNWAKKNLRFIDDPLLAVKARVQARAVHSWKQKLSDWWHGARKRSKHVDDLRLLRYAIERDDRALVESIDRPGFDAGEVLPALVDYKLTALEKKSSPADKAKRVALLRQLIEYNLRHEDWSESVLRMCDEDEAECKAETANVDVRFDTLAARDGLTSAEHASMIGEEYYALAELFERLKDREKEKFYALKCVEAYEFLKRSSTLKTARSAPQVLVPCLEHAGKFQDAQELLATLITAYPNEPTYLMRMARLHRKQKRLDQALQWLGRAEKVAYGYNWFNLVLIKTDVLLDLGRKNEAKAVVNAALSELTLDQDRESRNQIVVARLRAAQDKISH